MSRIYYEKDKYGNAREKVEIEDSAFIYTTNFQGDPRRDKFGSAERKAKIKVDPGFAEQLREIGVNVGQTKWEDPEYYVTIKVNFDFWKAPNINMVTDKGAKKLNADTIATLDDANINNVCVKCSTREHDRGKTLYVDTMYAELALDNDPWYDKYHVEEEEMPFR